MWFDASCGEHVFDMIGCTPHATGSFCSDSMPVSSGDPGPADIVEVVCRGSSLGKRVTHAPRGAVKNGWGDAREDAGEGSEDIAGERRRVERLKEREALRQWICGLGGGLGDGAGSRDAGNGGDAESGQRRDGEVGGCEEEGGKEHCGATVGFDRMAMKAQGEGMRQALARWARVQRDAEEEQALQWVSQVRAERDGVQRHFEQLLEVQACIHLCSRCCN